MYVCIRKSDGALCGTQSIDPLGGLISQAVADYGGEAADYEERVVADEVFASLLAAANQPTEAEQARAIRAQRDALLTACDWTQLPDSPLPAATKTAWAAYRQNLRDITGQAGFPASVTWPVAPGA